LSFHGSCYFGRFGRRKKREGENKIGSTYCINNVLEGDAELVSAHSNQCTISLVILARVQNGNRVAGQKRVWVRVRDCYMADNLDVDLVSADEVEG
jgi:hypothetical protein